jgi:ferric-dicitrate binding protein FerR (iron transport regulator)
MKGEQDDMSDDSIEALLRQVGARNEPSAATKEEVRRAVHDEWRTTVARRRRRRNALAFSAAASFAFVVLVAGWILRFAAPEADIAVTIARIDGPVSLSDSSRAARLGDPLTVGASVKTGETGRVAFAYGSGLSLRLDRSSALERVARDRFRLSAGAVYVDAPTNAKPDELVIETRVGVVRHLGTQYQVRQWHDAVEISIREGRVEIAGSDATTLAAAGEKIRISHDGRIERETISSQDPAWDWAETTAPLFSIEDRTLDEFLQWAARETGREVAYASAEAQREAENVRLRGSIDGLDPVTALSAVLSTTDFVQYEAGENLLGVRLAKEGDD